MLGMTMGYPKLLLVFVLVSVGGTGVYSSPTEDIPLSGHKALEIKEGSSQTIACSPNFPSLIIGNSYFRPDRSTPDSRAPCNGDNVRELLSWACDGKKSCVLSASKQDLGSSCGKTKMKLVVMYRCVRSKVVSVNKQGDKKKLPSVCQSLRSSRYCR
ncbi:uncharacterized protein LOC129594839 [Paramacrobiotus metropolitanus]|uniref:uncharacterized protein LOC129594839 n=1 Tax=Paramacrobiotus metropolitanus TaxID=2943436 RepID=UPI002445DC6F|nr:uncharacterized protein LOC129594839 [Paramacrobiotus metropolitanus]